MTVRERTKPFRPDREAIYIAWQGCATDIDGVGYTVSRGDRLRGSHAAVQALGASVFVEDGTPESEWPTRFDAVVAALEAEAAATPPKVRRSRITDATTIGELVVCTTQVLSSTAGPTEVGTIMLADDPRAKAAAEAFEPLGRRFE